MTDSIPFQQENAQSSITKRSLSPDEGEIIEDVKRRRESRSPSVNSARYQGDGRQHRVVYDGQSSRGGYGYQDRDTHDERRHDDAERYRDRDRRYEHAREPRGGERRDGRGFHPSRYHANERNSRQLTRSGNSSRHRSISSDQKYDSSHSRERTHSPNPLSSRNRISPSPQPKQVQFADDTKPPAITQEPDPVQEITMIDEEALIEARRRKREAILAKYQGQSTPSLVDNLKLQSAEASPAPASPINKIDSPRPGSRDTTPDFDTGDEKTFEFANSGKDKTASESREGPSAADYDPTDDMKLDNEKRHQHETVAPLDSADYDETKPTDQVILIPEKTPPLQQTPPQAADEDEDDMFATPVSPKSRPKSKEVIANKAAPVVEARQLDASMLDTWHDLEGYYIVILGEILNKRYVVQANLGKGMFSGVVRCLDNEQNGKQVAIKILRNNEAMRKAGLKEIGVLEKIMAADPEGRKHIIRFEGWFEHKGHLCLVFENLSLNLREVLKKFGRDVGINLKAVRAYAQQMFVGLSLLRKCNLLHADLKPDNILINENRTTLKIADLGSASDISENDITPYLVSRFYRAPEIILGLPYDYAIDTWSVGCTLFELYTGKILFPGRSNNQMLRLMIECRGRFPAKMLRRGQLIGAHFNEQLVFMSHETDSVTGNEVVKLFNPSKPTKELKQRILGSGAVADGEAALLSSFVDLLGRCLELNPERRITPAEAFRHPFIKT